MSWKRPVAIGFALVALVFAIVSLSAINWVIDENISQQETRIALGLRQWQYWFTHPTYGKLASPKYDYDAPEYYNLFGPRGVGMSLFLGSASDWKRAGNSALGLGILAIIFNGFAIIASLVTWKSFIQNWKLTALMGWIAGFWYIIAAIVYEGVRPAFHGKAGYDWPMGLFITSGVFVDVAAIFWYWDFTTPTKYDTSAHGQ